MARPLRIEFAGASYHVMSRGNARQAIFQDDGDRQRLCSRLEASVQRFGWRLMTFVFMPNHLHLLLRTPEPNLARGMQFVLSGYANWYAKRHQRPGHLFQGRYKGELIEDDSYFWTASRYIHLNPVRGRRPLRVGFAFAAQEIEAVPADARDARLHAVVTERGARRFR